MRDPFLCDDDLTFVLDDGYRIFTVDVDLTARRRGGRDDAPTQARLKTALFVETYLTFCQFQVMDIRPARPELYGARALSLPDDRSQTAREADAMALIGSGVGPFTLETCLTEGRKRAPTWFNLDAAALKAYMQTTHLAYGRAATPGATDMTIAEEELTKIKVLVHGVNRFAELREHHKKMIRLVNRKRPLNEIHPVDPFVPERYGFPPLLWAYQLAFHAAVDPTDLWFSWRRYSPFFKAVVLNSLLARKQPVDGKGIKAARRVLREVMPYYEGAKLPEDEIERRLLRIMGRYMDAGDRFKAKYGVVFDGPHGPSVSA